MESDQDTTQQRPSYDADIRITSTGGQSYPEVQTALHRKLKNLHVTMIRYTILSPYRSSTPTDHCFQYR